MTEDIKIGISEIEKQINDLESNKEENIVKLDRLKNKLETKLSTEKIQKKIDKFEKDSKGNIALLNKYAKRNPNCTQFLSQKKHFEKHLKLYYEKDKSDLSLREIRQLQIPIRDSLRRALTVLFNEINPFILQKQMFEMFDKIEKRLKKLEGGNNA